MNKTNNNVLVSVIMCVYNTPQDYLNTAVKSILDQTYNNFELVIVDDFSSEDLYKNPLFLDKRITILRNEVNKGPSFSRNRALSISKGKYIAIMDSDDYSYPTRLEEQVDYLEKNNDVVACGTWFKFFGDKTHEVKRIVDDQNYYKCCLLFDNVPTILNPSVMIRKSVLDTYQIRWNEELRMGEDYLMWVQLTEHGIVTNYNKVLLDYRFHSKQATNKNNRKKISENAWLIRDYQFRKIGITLNKSQIELLNNKKVKSYKIINGMSKLLKLICENNKKYKYFDQTSLIKRCDEYLTDVVKSTSNPFVLLSLCLTKQYSKIARASLKHKFSKLVRGKY